ncbi:RpiB/LacA/LacB family sugar-phosphate isomerase [Spiroplasma culicicola]|uniref:Galactose-6-phosphate isomerase subunit LacB n=1 Tax=Spiroplasma culicicola AES-1 TaxID=1276246 RepID=W6A797_9MOLU|nr:RpiB/LacA/LacB family sugar-phosphate isomerase [Spiroplasma culicicola]AHI53018.1 galactose-6-phosphate isomerase subunit LacB [Spiroplasma culicicola AES-1]
MKIAIGCDHIVTDVKNKVIEMLKRDNIEVIDCGTYDFERTHYPIYGQRVAVKVVQGEVEFGIVICGTGVGISNGAQKVKGARAILTKDVLTAIDAREKYDANIVGFGGRIVGLGLMYEIIEKFINTKYRGENDSVINEINQLIKKENYNEEIFETENKKWDAGFYNE